MLDSIRSGEQKSRAELHSIILRNVPQLTPGLAPLAQETAAGLHELFTRDPNSINAIYNELDAETGEAATMYALVKMTELVREDYSLLDHFANHLDGAAAAFTEIIGGSPCIFMRDKALYMFTAVLAHCVMQDISRIPRIIHLTWFCLGCMARDEQYQVSRSCMIEAILNLMKSDDLRSAVWENKDVQAVILDRITEIQPGLVHGGLNATDVRYKMLLAIYLLSEEPDTIKRNRPRSLINRVTNFLMQQKCEKIVRVGLAILKNCTSSRTLVGFMLNSHTLVILEGLAKEKWSDPEIYTRINDLGVILMDHLQNEDAFSKYMKELRNEELHECYLHSEEFWALNANIMLTQDCAALIALKSHLSADKPRSSSLACSDLTKFLTYGPQPQSLEAVTKHGLRDAVLDLLNHKNTTVQSDAILTAQTVILHSLGLAKA